jgi:poly(A) polymerase
VRNALLGEPVSDIDVATDATPDQVIGAAQVAGLAAIPTGVEHGTVTLLSGGRPFEVTTFRRDIVTDGRHAEVSFGTDVAGDAARRDFTINALYADRDGAVVDPLGGLPDLEARRVRFIGDADARIREDYLRILRYFRFHAWYADTTLGFDPEALAAIAANLDGLDQLSRERVGSEVRKLLSAVDPAPEVAVMEQTGVLARVLSGAGTTALAPLVHLEGVTGTQPDAMRRLAVLGGEDPQDALRLSKSDARRHRIIRDGIGAAAGLGEVAYRSGAELARDTALARAAVLGSPLPTMWRQEIADGAAAVFPGSSADLMPRLSGPALGQELSRLEARWIASGFALSREALLADRDGA